MLLTGKRVGGEVDVRATAAVVTAVSAALALGVLTAGVAYPDPLNPRDPDYCGDSPDILFCTEHRSTYPNAGESAFLTAIRGRFPPGSEAPRLAAGRAVCLELPRHPNGLIVEQVAVYLQTTQQTAAQVVDAARTHICPAVAARS